MADVLLTDHRRQRRKSEDYSFSTSAVIGRMSAINSVKHGSEQEWERHGICNPQQSMRNMEVLSTTIKDEQLQIRPLGPLSPSSA